MYSTFSLLLTATTLLALAAIASPATAQKPTISADFPFESQFLKVGDARLHYVSTGEGDPILFLHGVPMSAYSWRNILPLVAPQGRALALDFMGFGKSDKPDIAYSFSDQLTYLEAFIDSLQLTNLTLVMTDIGGIVGMTYAMRHPDNIKGLVMMETPLSDARTFHKNGGMMQRMMFWMAGKKKMGHRMFVKRNMFLKMMPMLIKRRLTKAEKEIYRQPFPTEASRLALYAPPKSWPRKGKNAQPGDMADFLNQYSAFIQASPLPKLLLYAKPGMLVNKKVLRWAKTHLPALSTVYIGKGKHLIEEDQPHAIGTAIAEWYQTLGAAAAQH